MTYVRRAFAVPVLLLALPLIAIGALASRELSQDYQSLTQARAATALSALRQKDATLHVRLLDALTSAWSLVERTNEQQGLSGIRDLAVTGKIAFAALYDQDHRLYPPDQSDAMLFLDTQKLRQVEPQILSARSALDHADAQPLGLAHLEGRPTPLLCETTPNGQDLCVVINNDTLQNILRQPLRPADDQWLISIVDPDHPQSTTTPALASLALSEPLRGWRLDARPVAPTPVMSPLWIGMGAIILPLMTAWISLAWHFHRTQRMHLIEARRRGEMIAQLSHELRTPIANLTLYADLLRRKADDPPAIARYCDIVEDEIKRLEALTESTLSFARGQDPTRHLQIAIPNQVTESIITHFQPLLDRAGCDVIVLGMTDFPLCFDRAAFEQCLIALLDNARKYAPRTPINVTTAIVGNRLRLSVHDQGPGIPAFQQDRVFDAMARGDHPNVEGFGLGLAAVRRLARAAGGEALLAPSEMGACFVVEMIAEMPPAPQPECSPCAS